MEQKTLVKMCIVLILLTMGFAAVNFCTLARTTRANIVYANHALLKAEIAADKLAIQDVNADVEYIRAGLVEIQSKIKERDKRAQDTADSLCRIEGKIDSIIEGKI